MHTALITGASRGLGLALARQLARRSWRLVIDARGADALEAARAVNAGEIAARYAEKRDKIPEAVHAARVSAVKAVLRE